jgi:hypothetical protein
MFIHNAFLAKFITKVTTSVFSANLSYGSGGIYIYDAYCYCWDMNDNNVAATSDSEELSGAEEILYVCDVMVSLVSISAAVLICESCSNYFL